MSPFQAEAPTEFLLYHGDRQSGPHTQEQVLALLQQGTVSKRDLIYYDGLGQWRPIEEIFEIEEQLSHFMDEGQEGDVIADIYRHIEGMLTQEEQIFYIAHGKKKVMRPRPDAAIVTNKRLLIQRQTLTGNTVEDCLWKNVVSVHTKEGMLGTCFAVEDVNHHSIEVDDLPHDQISRLCQIAQEMRQ
jgi:Bacterial PH domain/GYF domain 2